MLELCDAQRIWLSITATLALAIAGLISPTLGPYIKSRILGDNPPITKPAWYWWVFFILALSAGGVTGAIAAKASAKLCDRVAVTKIVCESVVGDRGASEVVTIQNQDDHEINMDRWKLCDFQGKHCYQFNHIKLVAQASIELRTSIGVNRTNTLYWNSKASIWNDLGDTALLIDRKGRTVDELSCPPLLSTPTPASSPTTTPTLTPTRTSIPTRTPLPTPTLPAISSADCTGYLHYYKEEFFEWATVDYVIDGNTIDVEIDGQLYQVRYDGIDSPNIFEDYGIQAQNRNRALVEGKTVMLILDMTDNDGEDEDYTDEYGRLIRYVIVDDHFVNYELLELGYAKVSTDYHAKNCQDDFLAAQASASDHYLGLWAFTIPLTPPATSSSRYAPCNCSGPDLNCSNFYSHSSAQACYDYCISAGFDDVFGLDGDHNGLACESLP